MQPVQNLEPSEIAKTVPAADAPFVPKRHAIQGHDRLKLGKHRAQAANRPHPHKTGHPKHDKPHVPSRRFRGDLTAAWAEFLEAADKVISGSKIGLTSSNFDGVMTMLFRNYLKNRNVRGHEKSKLQARFRAESISLKQELVTAESIAKMKSEHGVLK